MASYFIRATACEGQVRALAADTTELLEQIRSRHGATPVATAALGRAATAAAMMGAMLKNEEKLTVQIQGGGPIGQVVIDANAHGHVRGYVDEPLIDLPLNDVGKLDVGGAVGRDGFLHVIKDLGLKEPYRGTVPLVSGELAEDFTYYFAHSEQTPSAVALGVLVDQDYTVKASGGWIVQLLPGAPESRVAEIEARLSGLPPVTTLLAEGLSLEQLLERVVGPIQAVETMPLQFTCKCSLERVEQSLISLGKQQLTQLIEEDGKAEVVCHFCNETYSLGEAELRRLL